MSIEMASWLSRARVRPQVGMCEQCDELHFYPRERCPSCFSAQVTLVDAPLDWVVESFTWVWRAQREALQAEVPILVIAARALDADLAVIAEGASWSPDREPTIGETVAYTWGVAAAGTELPVFSPKSVDI